MQAKSVIKSRDSALFIYIILIFWRYGRVKPEGLAHLTKLGNIIIAAIFLFCLTAALPARAECDICDWKNWFTMPERPQPKKDVKVKAKPQKIVYYKEPFTDYPNDLNPIGLQNLDSREVVYCYDNSENSAESCAQYFERKGYVRFRDIPYKTANYDFLKVDTYPTRRWRDSEITSRW